MGSSLLVQQTNYKTMTMRTVPTKDVNEDSIEDVHNQIVKQIQRGKKLLKTESRPSDNIHYEDGSQERFG